MWLQCGRYTLLVFDGIDERPLSGRHVLLWRNPSDQDLLPSNRSFCLFFRRVLLGHWNPEIVCCVYFHPSRLVEIPRGLNLGNISHVSLKNPTSATLCLFLLLTDWPRKKLLETEIWKCTFHSTNYQKTMKIWKNIFWRIMALFWKSSRYPINATLMTSNRDVYCSVCVPVN